MRFICRYSGFFLTILLLQMPLISQESETFSGDTYIEDKTADEVASEEKTAEDKATEQKAAEEKSEKEKAEEEAEKIQSLNEQKRDVLKYGIDSEVLDIINDIRSENDDGFDDDLADLLAVNDNPEINRAIFDFFGQRESPAGREKGLQLVQDHLEDYEFSTNLILSAISYLGLIREKEAGPLFYDMLDDNNKSLASAALRGIGKLEDPSRAEEIMTLFTENEGDSEFEDLLASAILVLGDLGYSEAAVTFEDVLLDEDAPSVHRQYAAISLGKLQTESSFEILREQYLLLENSNLRSYVLKGLTEYDSPELEGILMSALRDSFWKIRVAASEGLGSRKVKEAVDILSYKVKRDPVRQVRYAAMSALGEISAGEGNSFLLEQFSNEKNPFDIRAKALDILLEKKISGTVDALDKVLQNKWEKDKSNTLGPICKTLSAVEWGALKPFYEAMLNSDDFIIRIYGIRGIKINKIGSLMGRLKELDTDSQPVNVRREVKAALESM